MLFYSDHEPTEAEMDQMYKDFMSQYGETEEEQYWNYRMSFEMHDAYQLTPFEQWQ